MTNAERRIESPYWDGSHFQLDITEGLIEKCCRVAENSEAFRRPDPSQTCDQRLSMNIALETFTAHSGDQFGLISDMETGP